MSSPPPERIGAYTIQKELGRGGMGVVYLGRDTRLDRAVAIKAMPEHVASDPDRLSRFEREAKTLATLSHPNVAGIYGVEEQNGHKYLILEYVEGESLADRLDRGPLSVADALEIAAQIAAGVEAAHEAGVIHRDLKPGNVVVTADGVAKVLDFGLARFEESSSSSAVLTDSPTLTTPVKNSPTMPGVILGTAAYMSPEQARGRRVDKRSDIWSFGVVLYELLTGASPFVGETATDSIGAILHKEIDLDRLPPETPPNVRHVLRRCLMRDKKQRYRDIGDVLLEITSPVPADAPAGPAPRRGLLYAVSAIAVLALAGWAVTWLRTPSPVDDSGSLHLSIPLEGGLELRGPLTISPDGTAVVFTATDQEGNRQIYLRRLDDFTMHPVPNTREGEDAVFSPDGASIAFFSRDTIGRVPTAGGSPVRLAGAKYCVGMSWGEDGTIVYSEGVNSPLLRIPETGATPETLTALADDNAYAHVWPQHIPGTRKLLFTSWVGGPNGGARILDLDSRKFHPIAAPQAERAGSFMPPGRWSASGHIIFERWSAGLQVMPFDPESETPLSLADARPLLENVYHYINDTRSLFSLSDNGVLAYVPGIPARRHLVLVDAAGNVEPILSQEDVDEYGVVGGLVSFSADERQVLFGESGDIMAVDLERRLPHRITDIAGVSMNACWSPDEKHVIFASNVEERWSIWSVGTAPGSTPELVLRRDRGTYPQSIAPDGSILFYQQSPETNGDLWILDPQGEATPVLATRASEFNGRFSPDGRWIAYASDATGEDEVYLIPTTGESPIQVSTGGGDSPQWSPKGTSLYFRRERKVLRVGFDSGRLVGTPEIVFDAPRLLTGPSYDISADETHMVAVQIDDVAIPDEIRVATNFSDEIRRVAGPGSRP